MFPNCWKEGLFPGENPGLGNSFREHLDGFPYPLKLLFELFDFVQFNKKKFFFAQKGKTFFGKKRLPYLFNWGY